jgi:dockerin type I repeat protein
MRGYKFSRFSRFQLLIFIVVFASIGCLIFKSFALPNLDLQGDLNSDNTVNVTDLSILLSNYGTANTAADINLDGTVDILDLSALLSHYGQNYTPPASGVAPPLAPSSYALPGGAVTVSSSSALASALAGSTRDIVLANGTYANATDMKIGTHRLWAQTLGGATLSFGLELGGNASGSGPEVHGLRFNLASSAATLGGGILNVWGAAGQNAVIDDSWISGNNVLDAGILARTTSGLQVHRVVVNGFNSWGIFFETYYPDYYSDNPAVPPVITDADISAVYRPSRGSSNGTAEAGLWAGTDCLCSRIKVRDTGWMGIWLGGNANNGTYSDFDIDNINGIVPGGSSVASIAVYLEHYSRNNIFKNFVIGNSSSTGVKVGFNCEWADPQYAGTNPVAGQSIAGCHFNTIQDGTIYSSYRGTQLEDAEQTTIQRVKFVGQTSAGIDDFMTSGSGYSTIWQGLGNDFSGLAGGGVQYTQAH